LNAANRLKQFASQPNATTQANLSMGESLLSWYSANATDEMQAGNKKFSSADRNVFKGYVTFVRKEGVADVTSLD